MEYGNEGRGAAFSGRSTTYKMKFSSQFSGEMQERASYKLWAFQFLGGMVALCILSQRVIVRRPSDSWNV